MPPTSLTWSALTSGVKAVISVCSSPRRARHIKPTAVANARPGFEALQSKLAQLHVPDERVLIGLEATSRDAREPLPVVAAPSQANPSVCESLGGLPAKTDQLDATTIAHVLFLEPTIIG